MSKLIPVPTFLMVVLVLILACCTWKNDFIQHEGKEHSNSLTTGKNNSHTQKVPQAQEVASMQVISTPEAIPVLVNKYNKLPDNYEPKDLVYPDIPFVSEKLTQKRKMRLKAAAAIEKLFTGARKDGFELLGVSAYRSHASQTVLFNYYVSLDGYETARTYSAIPGTSEHETGLAIDVTGGDGRCAAEDCFSGTPEAAWLEKHAATYGFIIRYPKGKDKITGYKYEPWHLRYVGKTIAKQIMDQNITLEEYLETTPVNK
jgi:zinc D-Ala-D-Ala carboxypeptidase